MELPTLFIFFNGENDKYNHCILKFSTITLDYQKYLIGNNIYRNVLISRNNVQCREHESRNSLYCDYKNEFYPFHSLVSSERIETTFRKFILILHLPWWDHSYCCIACNCNLKILTCQKWCSDCQIIYTGCKYCLTTNIVFGIIDQSQCKKCKRILLINIDITNLVSGNHIVDEFLDDARKEIIHKVANYINKPQYVQNVYEFIRNECYLKPKIKWIPYSQITNLTKIAEGGFSIIYKATRLNHQRIVAIKRFLYSQNISKHFLNEVIN